MGSEIRMKQSLLLLMIIIIVIIVIFAGCNMFDNENHINTPLQSDLSENNMKKAQGFYTVSDENHTIAMYFSGNQGDWQLKQNSGNGLTISAGERKENGYIVFAISMADVPKLHECRAEFECMANGKTVSTCNILCFISEENAIEITACDVERKNNSDSTIPLLN